MTETAADDNFMTAWIASTVNFRGDPLPIPPRSAARDFEFTEDFLASPDDTNPNGNT